MNRAITNEIARLGGDPTDEIWIWLVTRGPHGAPLPGARRATSLLVTLASATFKTSSASSLRPYQLSRSVHSVSSMLP